MLAHTCLFTVMSKAQGVNSRDRLRLPSLELDSTPAYMGYTQSRFIIHYQVVCNSVVGWVFPNTHYQAYELLGH